MTPLKFTDEGGNLVLATKEQIARVMHHYGPLPPLPPSPIASCVVLIDGSGLYVQESVEKVLSIIQEAA